MTNVMDSQLGETMDEVAFNRHAVARQRAEYIAGSLAHATSNTPRKCVDRVVLFVDFLDEDLPLREELQQRLPRVEIAVYGQSAIGTVEISERDAVVVDTMVRGTRGVAALDHDLHMHASNAKYCVTFTTPEQTVPTPVLGALTSEVTQAPSKVQTPESGIEKIVHEVQKRNVSQLIVFSGADSDLASQLGERTGLKVMDLSLREMTHLAGGKRDAVIIEKEISPTLLGFIREDQKFAACVFSVDPTTRAVEEIEMPRVNKLRSLAVRAEAKPPRERNGQGCATCVVKCCDRNREKGEQVKAAAERGELDSPYLSTAAAPPMSLEDRIEALTQKGAARKAARAQQGQTR
jgi:hypothetical protein